MSALAVERVQLGTWVKVSGFVPGVKSVFHLVTETEVSRRDHKVSVSSGLGSAMLNAKVGDTIQIDLYDEQLKLTVLEVGRD